MIAGFGFTLKLIGAATVRLPRIFLTPRTTFVLDGCARRDYTGVQSAVDGTLDWLMNDVAQSLIADFTLLGENCQEFALTYA